MVEQLYTEFHSRLLARCTAMCHDSAMAEDLVQETFLRALTHIGDLQDLSSEQRRAWLYKTAQRLYIDHIRKASRETDSDPVDLEIRVADGAVSITAMGEVTEHIHSFGTELKFDETNHWRECACGAKTTPQAHDYGNDQDETCNICGYEREVVHVHTLNWLYNSTGHWQECFFCKEKVTSVEPHEYDDDQDVTCNVCDYVRQPPHSHDFGPGWKSDACAHWQECSCGEKTGRSVRCPETRSAGVPACGSQENRFQFL